MAKVSFTKLALSRNTELKFLEWKDQKIEIKQYLPINEKLDLISKIVGFAIDENAFCNPCRVDIIEKIQIVLTYANINLTEKQSEDIFKLYDLFVSSGFYNAVLQLIPKEEINYIIQSVDAVAHEVYTYRNSAKGIMEQVVTDQQMTEEGLTSIITQIKESEELKHLQDLTTQLG